MAAQIRFIRTGSGDPLILVHGLGSRKEVWDPTIPLLAERFDIIAIDLPGFGSSPVLDGRVTVTRLVDEIVSFARELGLARPHVAGNSLGGAIALELAQHDVVRSATAFSPVGFWRTAGRVWCQQALSNGRRLAKVIDPLVPIMVTTAVGRGALGGLVFGHPSRVDRGALLGDVKSLASASGFASTADAFTGYEVPAVALPVPTTIAWGTRDVLLTYRTQARRARTRLPDARHVSLAHCGHTPFYDDPALCVATILDTARRVSPTASEESAP